MTTKQFYRCHQCKSVFRTLSECTRHAELTQHAYKPAYFCTVCSQSFSKCKKRAEHIKTTGHIQRPPASFATVPAPTIPSTSAVPTPSLPAQSRRIEVVSDDFRSVAPDLYGPDPTGFQVFCLNCHQQFADYEALFAHRRAVHRRPNAQTATPPASAVPAEPSPGYGRATAHTGSSSASNKSTAAASIGEEEQPYYCCNCFQVMDSALMTAAHTHATGHKEFTPLITEVACPKCPQKFKAVGVLEKHRSDVHSRSASIMLKSVTVHSEADGEVQAAATTPDTRCAKCNMEFTSTEALQAHYDESPLHPTCHTCGLGFASIGPWATHKARCPPPGSTKVTNGGMSDHSPAAPSRKGKEVERDVTPTGSESSVPESARGMQRSVDATAESTSAISLTATANPVTAASTIPTVPGTPEMRRAPSPTPSTAISTASLLSHADASSQTVPHQFVLEDHRDMTDRVLRPEKHTEPDNPPREADRESASSHDHSTSEAERGSPADGMRMRGSPATYPTPLSGRTQSGTPSDLHRSCVTTQAEAEQSPKPLANRNPDAVAVSFHCRSCLRDPCVQPIATMCGHIFCHRCIMQELATKTRCPVCQRTFFVRLHVEGE